MPVVSKTIVFDLHQCLLEYSKHAHLPLQIRAEDGDVDDISQTHVTLMFHSTAALWSGLSKPPELLTLIQTHYAPVQTAHVTPVSGPQCFELCGVSLQASVVTLQLDFDPVCCWPLKSQTMIYRTFASCIMHDTRTQSHLEKNIPNSIRLFPTELNENFHHMSVDVLCLKHFLRKITFEHFWNRRTNFILLWLN